ncbi:hypothetical protein VVD49_03610 [Uliginosibacterium sp. H3]|uniref:Uncharacterized protein n=1 Tax=Uliginosibacterium silvisoli TaxID=3114758 RepID=A0ABU6JZE1_9RHOO|nr:hypothetical protein [Uliginosibacterium sp. H3]
MSTTKPTPEQSDSPSAGSERPNVGWGQDDAYATESNPEGLRYNEKPHKPGELPKRPVGEHGTHQDPPISVGEE